MGPDRRRLYISRQQDIMDGAVWRDSERTEEWMGDLTKSDPVVVFCAYGFHVDARRRSRSATRASTRNT